MDESEDSDCRRDPQSDRSAVQEHDEAKKDDESGTNANRKAEERQS